MHSTDIARGQCGDPTDGGRSRLSQTVAPFALHRHNRCRSMARGRSTKRITCIVRAWFATLLAGSKVLGPTNRSMLLSSLPHRDESKWVSRRYRLSRRREGGLRWRTRSPGPLTTHASNASQHRRSRCDRSCSSSATRRMPSRISRTRLGDRSGILVVRFRAARCRLTTRKEDV
jgi:hypothetical protein